MTIPLACIAILGGSFDPVHNGHIAVAQRACELLRPDQLRIVPTGLSRLKQASRADPVHRIAMLKMAFQPLSQFAPLLIDDQEVRRAEVGIPSYSVDTLTHIRQEQGTRAALIMIIGADQLLQLQHWKHWEHLFDLAHLLVMTRPGFELDELDSRVAYEFGRRQSSVAELHNQAFGRSYLCSDLQVEISSTLVRETLATGQQSVVVPPEIMNYIHQHHLY